MLIKKTECTFLSGEVEFCQMQVYSDSNNYFLNVLNFTAIKKYFLGTM